MLVRINNIYNLSKHAGISWFLQFMSHQWSISYYHNQVDVHLKCTITTFLQATLAPLLNIWSVSSSLSLVSGLILMKVWFCGSNRILKALYHSQGCVSWQTQASVITQSCHTRTSICPASAERNSITAKHSSARSTQSYTQHSSVFKGPALRETPSQPNTAVQHTILHTTQLCL